MNKLLNMLGLAKRAGKISTGSFICEKMIKSNNARLVVVAKDASKNTKKAIFDACGYHKVRIMEYSDMLSLGNAVGAGAPRAVVSVNDNNFAKAILDIYISIEKEKG